MSAAEKTCIFLVGVFVCCFICAICMALPMDGRDAVRQEAVKAGVAKFVADDTGRVHFQWITPTK